MGLIHTQDGGKNAGKIWSARWSVKLALFTTDQSRHVEGILRDRNLSHSPRIRSAPSSPAALAWTSGLPTFR